MNGLDFEVAVVGAGPIGSAAARHLAREISGVALIGPSEPETYRDHVGPWSGSYDEGRMAHSTDLPLLSGLIGLRARRRFASLEAATGITFARPVPALTVAPGDAAALARFASGDDDATHVSEDYFDIAGMLTRAEDLGVEAELLDEDALAKSFPEMTFAAGHIAVHQPDALLLNPRRLVLAETAAAVQSGAVHLLDEVKAVDRQSGRFELTTRRGNRYTSRRVVLAAGAYTNLAGFLPQPLAFSTFGATVTLAAVAEDTPPFPTTMYFKATETAPYAGIVAPPLRYPDGISYIKGAGASLLEVPLDDAAAAEDWVRTGGKRDDIDAFAAVLAELVSAIPVQTITTRPCLVTLNDSGSPYIGAVEEDLIVATEGEHGVTMADEIGRLAARIAIDGEWRDTLPSEVFTPRFR